MNDTKITLLMPEQPSDFHLKNIVLIISQKRSNKCEIKAIYMQGILYQRKENT